MFGEKEEDPSYGTHWGLFYFFIFLYYEPIIIYLNENMINFKLKLNLYIYIYTTYIWQSNNLKNWF